MRIFKTIVVLSLSAIMSFYSFAETSLESFDKITPKSINGHILERVAPETSINTIQAARDEVLRGLTILVDVAFTKYGGIDLNLTNKDESEEMNREYFTHALNTLMNDIKDPAGIAIELAKMDFNKFTTESPEKNLFMTFMCIDKTPDKFDLKEQLLKLATLKDNTKASKNNTIVAQHLWNTCLPHDWLTKPWEELSEQDQIDIQALSDSGSIPFQYLRAYHVFKESLNASQKMNGLLDIIVGTMPTIAARDFWRVLEFDFLRGVYGEREMQEAVDGWKSLINSIPEQLPLSQQLIFKPIQTSRDSEKWPKGYKTALYGIAGYDENESLLDVLRTLTEKFKTLEIAELYLYDYLRYSTARNPEKNDARIAEMERICVFVPRAKRIKAHTIGSFNHSLFAEKIGLNYHLDTPEKRLKALQSLSDEGIVEATDYLTNAYALSMSDAPPPLVNHLGISSRGSLSVEERTFGNLAQLHKDRTVDLIRLGLKGNKNAQRFLFKRLEKGAFSIVETLFDNRSTLGSTPNEMGQGNMNIMLDHMLHFAFNVANILQEEHKVPEFFYPK